MARRQSSEERPNQPISSTRLFWAILILSFVLLLAGLLFDVLSHRQQPKPPYNPPLTSQPTSQNPTTLPPPVTVISPHLILGNTQEVSDEWKPFRTNVASVEQRTGLHFLTNVPIDVASVLRQKIDMN